MKIWNYLSIFLLFLVSGEETFAKETPPLVCRWCCQKISKNWLYCAYCAKLTRKVKKRWTKYGTFLYAYSKGKLEKIYMNSPTRLTIRFVYDSKNRLQKELWISSLYQSKTEFRYAPSGKLTQAKTESNYSGWCSYFYENNYLVQTSFSSQKFFENWQYWYYPDGRRKKAKYRCLIFEEDGRVKYKKSLTYHYHYDDKGLLQRITFEGISQFSGTPPKNLQGHTAFLYGKDGALKQMETYYAKNKTEVLYFFP
ncbi:MAG: hypothetical protein D6805_07065 [Planctomycetota bacterium]|nr:MAG: hypothetical protein D6805_07065 [Planctomycetota bacterium]